MMRMASPRSAWNTTGSRPAEDMPKVTSRSSLSEWSGSAPVSYAVGKYITGRNVRKELFWERDDFPHLTVAHLMAGVPPGVEGVEYEINLNGFDPLCIAGRASDAPDLL